MPSFLPIPVEIQRRHGGECESTRAMNLANRPREIVDRGSGSSMIAATIVHNFHGERGGGGVGRPRSHFSAHESDTRTGTIRGSREFSRNFSSPLLPPRLRFVRARFRWNEGGGEEREGGVVVSIQMRKFRIYTARQAIISGGRETWEVRFFCADLLSRSNGSSSV